MKGNFLKRLDTLEKATNISTIPDKDKFIVVSYRDGDEAEYNRLVEEKMKELRGKYGPNIKESDFTVVGIRKFYR